MKTVVFTDLGYPALEQPGPPPNHLVVPADTALRLDDGRVLAPDGSYRWWLLGQPAFGGADGRQAAMIPDDVAMIGKSWADLAALKSAEHPHGLLKVARPETAAEKKAREKAEADALAAAEAAEKAKAEAAALEAVNGRTILPEQLQVVVILQQIKPLLTEALKAAGKSEIEIEAAVAMIDYRTRPIRYDDATLAACRVMLEWDQAAYDAFWAACEAVVV